MKNKKQNEMEIKPFNDFLTEIEDQIEKCKTNKQYVKIIEKLENYKQSISIENEIYKQSTIDAIDDLIEQIKNF